LLKKWHQLLILVLVLGSVGIGYYLIGSRHQDLHQQDIVQLKDFYSLNVQPIFNNKCVACHSCFNSPCQLDLTSYDGLERGGNTINVYDFPKVEARDPTRLYIDAHSVEAWRKKGFYSVIGRSLQNLLSYMVSVPDGIESGKQNKYDAEYSRTCIQSTEESNLKKYAKANPAGRMPLGFPALEKKEIDQIQTWLSRGEKGPDTLTLERAVREEGGLKGNIQKWEEFFNRPSLKEKIAARYLYEHLFLASIYFDASPNIFFRLVRSKTKTGDIDEIGTSYPFDDPGKEFSYRLRPVTNVIGHKSHIPFEFSQSRREKWEKDFFQSEWKDIPTKMPPYGREGSNPFVIFKSMPVEARYQFFLDNAGYHIMTFIKGPVCRGQTALNVINDHFWVLFMDPKQDVMVNSPEAYAKIADEIEFPSLLGDKLFPLVNFRERYWKSIGTKFKYLEKQKPLDAHSLWIGDKEDSNATITVYRHFDSATVLRGLRGQMPKTVWVLDYQVFESIYYNLTAGYNVFGPVLHQLNSRLYMEVSRVASEDLFLSFLPKESRRPLRKNWNLPVPHQKESILKFIADTVTSDIKDKLTKDYVYAGGNIESRLELKAKDPANEFLKVLKTEHYNKSQYEPISDQIKVLSGLGDLPASIVRYLPDTILLEVKDDDESELWTLIHNRDHYNVGMLLFENDRLRPEKDTLDVIRNAATSYANLIVILKRDQLQAFAQDLSVCKSQAMVWSVMKKYGLSRSNPEFWMHFDRISKLSSEKLTNERGFFDLNRYLNL